MGLGVLSASRRDPPRTPGQPVVLPGYALARRAGVALALVLGGLAGEAFSGGSVEAQEALLDGRIELRLPSPGTPIPVEMEYRLLPDSGSREVVLTLLSPGGARLLALRASWTGGALPLTLLELRPHYWSGSVTLPTREEGSPAPPLTLGLTYEVDGGWEESGRATVPILAVTWVPRDPHPRTFVARVDVPAGVTVTESFPTSVVTRPRGAEGGSYEMALQGVPSMLVLRTVQGEAPFLTLEGILDGFVVAILLLMGALGIRYLKGGRG